MNLNKNTWYYAYSWSCRWWSC